MGVCVGGGGGSAGVAGIDVDGEAPPSDVVTGGSPPFTVDDGKKFPILFNAIGGSFNPKNPSEQSAHAGSNWRIAAGMTICGLYSPGNTTEQGTIWRLHSGSPYQAL